jgi:hypothetical protein
LHNEDLSELAKANIEALARPEKPTEPNFIGGDSGSGNLKDAYVDISINTNPVPNIYDEYYKKMIYQNGKCEKKRMRIPSMDGQCQSN